MCTIITDTNRNTNDQKDFDFVRHLDNCYLPGHGYSSDHGLSSGHGQIQDRDQLINKKENEEDFLHGKDSNEFISNEFISNEFISNGIVLNRNYTNKDEDINALNEEQMYMHDLKIYSRKKNNKYIKKKEMIKKRKLRNHLNQIGIPSCEESKDSFYFRNLRPVEKNNISLEENSHLNKICDISYSEHIINSSKNVDNVFYTNNVESENKNMKEEEHQHLIYKDLFVKSQIHILGRNNKDNIFYMNTVNVNDVNVNDVNVNDVNVNDVNINDVNENTVNVNDVNENTQKDIEHSNIYFEDVKNARSIILIILNFFFYLFWMPDSQQWNVAFLKKLKKKDLLLILRAYNLCAFYINVSEQSTKIMNNEKNVFSSKFHKQLLSIIPTLIIKMEMKSEVVHYPYQIDVLIKRKDF